MEPFLGKYSSCLYTTLRIIAGLMFAMHGSQKLLAWPGGSASMSLASLLGVAGVVELIGGLMIAFGFLTSYAALIASGEMAVAYFKAHAPQGALPLLNRGELAVVYCFLFLYMASQGGGAWSLDSMMRRKQ
jgi:putative oxidoreductase